MEGLGSGTSVGTDSFLLLSVKIKESGDLYVNMKRNLIREIK